MKPSKHSAGKRIGLVLASPPGYSETFFNNKIKALQEGGHEVILFVDRISIRARGRQVGGFSLPNSRVARFLKVSLVLSLHALFCPKRVAKFVRLEKADGVASFDIIKNLYRSCHILRCDLDWLHFGFATLAVGRENVAQCVGAKLGVSIRGFDIGVFPLGQTRVYERLWRRISKLHTISHDLLNAAYAFGLNRDTPVETITPAIDHKMFSPVVKSSKDSPHVGPVKIVTVARLNWKKGIDVALLAMHELKKLEVDFKYIVVGEGEERQKLIFLIHLLKLSENVILNGRKSHQEVSELLKDADIYVQPSIQEGFCNAVLEAQASGLPCIVTDAEGLAENVIHGITGWVVPRLNPAALTEQLYRVYSMPAPARAAICRAARKRVEEHFNLDLQKQKFVAFYQS